MRFAVFTVSLPEWTPDEAVRHLAALGYDGVEWRVVDPPPHDGAPYFWAGNRCTLPLRTVMDDAPRIRSLCAEHGLVLPNLGTYVSCLDAPSVAHAMEAAVALGAPSVRVQVPRYDGRAERTSRVGRRTHSRTYRGASAPPAPRIAYVSSRESFDVEPGSGGSGGGGGGTGSRASMRALRKNAPPMTAQAPPRPMPTVG